MFGAKLRQQKSPMAEMYHPETYDTPLLDAMGAAKFWALVDSANWAVTLGCFDIQYATQMMSRLQHGTSRGTSGRNEKGFQLSKEIPKMENHH
jgi:hypothetical protein